MKLIMTGVSGFIGHEALTQAISHPDITSIIALTRKPIQITSPKLKTIIHSDFSSYPPSVMSQLEGASACIWVIGAKTSDVEITRRTRLEYGMAAAQAFSSLPQPEGQTFKFVFVSGIVTVPDQSANIWFFSEARKIAGLAENMVLALAQEKEKTTSLESFIIRPASVLAKDRGLLMSLRRMLPYAVGIEELAAVLIDLALHGSKKLIWENKDLRVRGEELIKGSQMR